ncbi:helix-turn-helix transcriptional regulator [Bosea sp. F3-2]|uniref:helix-turn-helix domain-containing protein n=1 Tax=Bosea sp. F3-2 TaxID=2599640 RepID=UPI0011EE316B|nr:AraC family transcriptional regulator [Bosea sp. F3-2]QEL26514.1 helix-turn-helix transcriptional regulator [Bosea sp. F3-2]
MKLGQIPSQHAVREAITASLQCGASLQDIASKLGVSARSLQRHLAAHGTSHSEIVTEVRLAIACRLLTETNEKISRIALLLGYTGPPSFSRSFRRLMKIQPANYRRQQRK